jgi:hypothetical protein
MPREYDKIKLKTGEIGRILEDFGDGSYIAEISLKTGDIETTEIKISDIASVFVETETPLSLVV